MSSCLGMYIEENLIKYAKVSKVQNNITVDSFGVKFYDKLDQAIQQVIEETYSQKTPISVNLSEEMYNYFDMFSLLSKSDLQKAIKTEFDSFCVDRGYNPNVFTNRYAIVENKLEKDKLKVIYVSNNKIEINKRIQQLEGYKLSYLSPISMDIPNLIDIENVKNAVIINIEEQTTVTQVIDKKIYNVEILDEGSSDIFNKINLKENSYSKTYEIIKNTTIYTSEGKELQEEQTSYLEDIMPTLYAIVGKVRKIINESTEKYEKIYITGTSALINNIDLYFQEYFADIDCEILKPYFVENTKDISIKDYIEVNSAISLSMMGLGEGIEGMNFKKQNFLDKVPDWLKIEVDPEKKQTPKQKKNSGGFFTWDLGQKLDKTEISLVRTAIGLFLLVIIYSTFSTLLSQQIEKKQSEAETSISSTNKQIDLVKKDDEKVKSKTNEYTTMINNLQEINSKLTESNKLKNAIPNLLNQIMTVIPENAQVTSIENTSGTHITINAQSNKYEQLGYFKAKIKSAGILTDVISTAGQKDSGIVTVTIEGELP